MSFLRLNRPKLSLFWSLPFLVALIHDLLVWQTDGVGFHFSEIGYLIQHYTSWHDPIVFAIDSPVWRAFLKTTFETKVEIPTGILALIALFWLNRRPHRERQPSNPRGRR